MMLVETAMESLETQLTLAPSERTVRVANRVRTAIARCSYSPVRRLTCRCRDDRLVVCGRLPTYFMKQVAIELVRQHPLDGVPCEYAIEVD